MIRINLRIDDSSTKLDDVKEPDIKLKASSLFTSGCQCLKKLTNLTLAHKLGAGQNSLKSLLLQRILRYELPGPPASLARN
jgi:hypothetical protein